LDLTTDYHRILIIRLGALGDLALCNAAFQALRERYPRATIALLTQPQWRDFARSQPWFDQIIEDTRPSSWQLEKWLTLWQRLRRFDPQLVIDLQGKTRQTILYALLGGWHGPDWSGAAPRCRFPRVWPPQPNWHFTDFIAAQLQVMGITAPKPTAADYQWLDAPIDALALPEKFVLLVPGCSPTHPEKRWPASSYAQLAQTLHQQGLASVMIGTKAEADVLTAIQREAPEVINLGGRTGLLQIGAIARRAQAVIGNDTGPVHLAAATGTPTLTLFSGTGTPVWSAPIGRKTQWLQETTLDALPVERVLTQLRGMLE
jgi:ADP-heptose:LPS heptosyltransferase